LHSRLTGRIDPAVAFAIVIAAMLGSSGCAAPQVSEKSQEITGSIDAETKAVDAEVTAYLQKHPVRPSLLFEAVSTTVGTLGETQVMAMHECEYETEFRDWEELIPKMRENTTVALLQSFSKGKLKDSGTTLAGQPVSRSFCAELKRRYAAIELDLAGLGQALRKQGY